MSRLTEVKLPILVKLGSLAVHVEEFLSPGGHEFDRAAIGTLLADAELQEYLGELRKAGFLPLKRTEG